MRNRIIFLILIATLLVGLFFYKPLLFPVKPRPTIEDRLPDAPLIGKINIVDFVDQLGATLLKNKISGRDVIASDFILSQTKNTGVNLQDPAYFYFVDGVREFGVVLSVNDSSKVPRAVAKIKTFFDVRDTIVNTQIIYKIDKYNLYFCYENNWFFIYRGNHFTKNYFQIKYADHTSMKKRWKNFLSNKFLRKEDFSFYYRSKEMAKKRLDYMAVSIKVDSNSVYLKSIIADRFFFPIKLKTHASGIEIHKSESVSQFIDLHLITDELKVTKDHFIYTFIQKYARKINFPLNDFLQKWGGDASIVIGGKTKVKEDYIETEFDDNFNPIEVRKERMVDRENMMSYMSSSEIGFRSFVNQLFARGFLTKTQKNFNFLIIPDVKLVQQDKSFVLYTTEPPKIGAVKPINGGKIIYDNSVFHFKISGIERKEMFLNVSFPVSYLIRKYNIRTSY